MPTPVGPAPRDPDDPDLWDWDGPEEDLPAGRRWLRALIAAVLVVATGLFIVASLA